MADTSILLNPCIAQILCGLSTAVLNALKGIIQSQIAVIDTLLVTLEAKLAVLEILTIPPQLVAAALEEVVNEVKAAENLIPLALIGDCVGLGDLTSGINTILDTQVADIEDQLRDLTRLLSVKAEIEFAIAQYTALKAQFNAILDVITACAAAPAGP